MRDEVRREGGQDKMEDGEPTDDGDEGKEKSEALGRSSRGMEGG